MINIIFTPSVLLAFLMSCTFLLLYLVKYVRTSTSFSFIRAVDAIYILLGFLYIVILLVHGWRLDPILIFAQYLLFMMANSMMLDNLRLRKILFTKINNEELFTAEELYTVPNKRR